MGDVTLGFILYWERCCCKRQALLALGQCLSPLKPQSPCLNKCRLVGLAWCGGVDLHLITENAAIPNVSSRNARVFPNMPVMLTCIFTLVKLNKLGMRTDLFKIYWKWVGQNICGIIETPRLCNCGCQQHAQACTYFKIWGGSLIHGLWCHACISVTIHERRWQEAP